MAERRRVFKSALNDVTYWAGRPLGYHEGMAFIQSNAFIQAMQDWEKRKDKALADHGLKAKGQQHD